MELPFHIQRLHLSRVFLAVLTLVNSYCFAQVTNPQPGKKYPLSAMVPSSTKIRLDSNTAALKETLYRNGAFIPKNIAAGHINRTMISGLDSCSTYTYRLILSKINCEETVRSIAITASGELLLAGKIKQNGSLYDALLIKLDANGNLLWAKTFGEPSAHETFSQARGTSDGGIIVIGSSYPDIPGDGSILICKLDNNGVQQWTRRYKTPVPGTLARGVDIIEQTDGSFAFVGDNGQLTLFGVISSAGSMLWSKTTAVSATVSALRILQGEDGVFIATTGMENGWHVADIFKINPADGALAWNCKLGGAAMNQHFIFHKMEYINLRPRITGIHAGPGQPYNFMRLTFNSSGFVETMEDYVLPGLAPDTTAMSSTTPWSQALAFSRNNLSTDFTLVRNSPDITYEWASSFNHSAPFLISDMEKTVDAGFITACNTAGNILLIKTDSAGLSPGCDGTTENLTRTVNGLSFPSSTIIINNSSWEETTSPITSLALIEDTLYSCKQLTCPVPVQEDTCISSFYKTYRSAQFAEVSTSFSETSDNNLLLSGAIRSNPYEPLTTNSFILKMNKKGNILARRQFGIGNENVTLKQKKTIDGNTLVSGYFNDPTGSAIYLAKIDNNLNLLWNKSYKLNTTSYQFIDMTQSSSGEIYIFLLYLNFGQLSDKMAILKFDANGNMIWHQTYRANGAVSLFSQGGTIVTDGNYIYCCIDQFYDVEQKYKALVSKFNITDGSAVWSKRYSYTNVLTRFNDMLVQNNHIYLSGYVDNYPPDNEYAPVLMRLDLNGAIEKLSLNRVDNTVLNYKFTLGQHSDLLLAGIAIDYSSVPTGAPYDMFIRLDSNFIIKNSRKTQNIQYESFSQGLESAEGNIFEYGYNSYDDAYNGDFFLKKYLPDGTLGSCSSDTMLFEQLIPPLSITDQGLTMAALPFLQNLATSPVFEDCSIQQHTLYCSATPNCDTLWLSGPQAICDSSNAYVFKAHKNTGCTAPVTWNTGSLPVQVLQSSDSLVKVRFLQNGSFKIRSKIFTGCRWLEDSLSVSILFSPGQCNLGADFNLCPNNTHILNAHAGFATYLWQDGSADSLYTVTSPGTYFVTVTDACNNIFRDTVIVGSAPPVFIDLGPDLSKCNKDSLLITAPSGFINYTWGPNYNINTTTGQTIIVFPASDTSYNVQAEKTPGCFAYDTLRIIVNHSSPVNLGPDASLCSGDSLLLDAGTGFSSYQWSTGAQSQKIFVKNNGAYRVIANAANGCHSTDTLNILQVYNNAVVTLDQDSVLCAGSAKVLKAGNFSGYLWSNGNTSSEITVSSIGLYWVHVTDINGCKGADTTKLTKLNPLPTSFLPADTFICSYSTIQLKPLKNYATYQWNNGAITSSITVSQPGIYWLMVSDNYHCSGTDSILVNPKQCMEGFYIPSAFTPNGDGKNDTFKPLLFGQVVEYEFAIYDRWGDKIFETTEIQKGWDGLFKGTKANSNVFVWKCTFRFSGQNLTLRKGTVTLIR